MGKMLSVNSCLQQLDAKAKELVELVVSIALMS